MAGKTSKEKWELLGALYQHGTNISKLSDVLPGWSETQIRAAILRYRNKATRQFVLKRKTNKSDPIDEWHDLLEKCHLIEGTSKRYLTGLKRKKGRAKIQAADNYSFLLSKIFMHASCFEEHFQTEDPDDPNYNEIYRYLALLLVGEEPPQLRPGSAAKILQMLAMMKKIVSDEDNISQYLNFFENIEVSYLKPEMTVEEAIEQRHSQNQDNSAGATASLFEDEQNEECLSDLDDESPTYDTEQSQLLGKLSQRQEKNATSIINIAGINPLEVPSSMLAKPYAAMTKN